MRTADVHYLADALTAQSRSLNDLCAIMNRVIISLENIKPPDTVPYTYQVFQVLTRIEGILTSIYNSDLSKNDDLKPLNELLERILGE
jgi:hypothetical protein